MLRLSTRALCEVHFWSAIELRLQLIHHGIMVSFFRLSQMFSRHPHLGMLDNIDWDKVPWLDKVGHHAIRSFLNQSSPSMCVCRQISQWLALGCFRAAYHIEQWPVRSCDAAARLLSACFKQFLCPGPMYKSIQPNVPSCMEALPDHSNSVHR